MISMTRSDWTLSSSSTSTTGLAAMMELPFHRGSVCRGLRIPVPVFPPVPEHVNRSQHDAAQRCEGQNDQRDQRIGEKNEEGEGFPLEFCLHLTVGEPGKFYGTRAHAVCQYCRSKLAVAAQGIALPLNDLAAVLIEPALIHRPRLEEDATGNPIGNAP